MYHFEYDYENASHPALFDVKMYRITDKFLVPDLKDAAFKKFNASATEAWNTDAFPVIIRVAYDIPLAID